MSDAVSPRKAALFELLKTLLIIAIGLAVGIIVILIVSDTPGAAIDALLTGPLPTMRVLDDGGIRWTGMARFGVFIEDMTTLALCGLAIALPFRARQFSLGADGQLQLGALASASVALYAPFSGWPLMFACVAAAIAAGFLLGLVAGELKARAGANEIVTTLMLNVIVAQLLIFLVTNHMRDPNEAYLVTSFFPEGAQLKTWVSRTHITAMVVVTPLICLATYLYLARSNSGYELRTAGLNMNFAYQMGMPVTRSISMSMALGGAAAGLAGFHVANGILRRLPYDFPASLGLEGIVVALLARNDPRLIMPAAALYSYLRAGAQVMEQTTDVSREMMLVVQAIIVLLVVSPSVLPRLRAMIGRKK